MDDLQSQKIEYPKSVLSHPTLKIYYEDEEKERKL
jgi:hypothetical protein